MACHQSQIIEGNLEAHQPAYPQGKQPGSYWQTEEGSVEHQAFQQGKGRHFPTEERGSCILYPGWYERSQPRSERRQQEENDADGKHGSTPKPGGLCLTHRGGVCERCLPLLLLTPLFLWF